MKKEIGIDWRAKSWSTFLLEV